MHPTLATGQSGARILNTVHFFVEKPMSEASLQSLSPAQVVDEFLRIIMVPDPAGARRNQFVGSHAMRTFGV